MGGLVSSVRPSLPRQLLPGAGLGNCELNCIVFRCHVEFRFIVYWSMNISQDKVKKLFTGKTSILFVLFLLFDNFRGQ